MISSRYKSQRDGLNAYGDSRRDSTLPICGTKRREGLGERGKCDPEARLEPARPIRGIWAAFGHGLISVSQLKLYIRHCVNRGNCCGEGRKARNFQCRVEHPSVRIARSSSASRGQGSLSLFFRERVRFRGGSREGRRRWDRRMTPTGTVNEFRVCSTDTFAD